MENENFLTLLFMSLFGIIIIMCVIIMIIVGIFKIISKPNLEQEAVKIIAQIEICIEKGTKNKVSKYSVKYEIDGKEYNNKIEIKDKNLKEGDKIYVYYVPGNENELYLSNERNIIVEIIAMILQILLLTPIMVLGVKCIKNYNVFKYRRTINIE